MPRTTEANPESIFVARTLLGHVEDMNRHVVGVRAADDAEGVHQMRVASRRLRNAMQILRRHLPRRRRKTWRRRVRGVTRALGAARDADVQIEAVREAAAAVPAAERDRVMPGLEHLLRRLETRRETLQPPLDRVMDDFEACVVVGDLREALERMGASAKRPRAGRLRKRLGGEASRAITRRLGTMRAYDEVVRDPERVAELHEMRIAAKHLRYTLETYAALFDDGLKDEVRAVKEVQTLLGEIHDADLWLDELPRLMEEERSSAATPEDFERIAPGLAHFLDDRRRRRERSYAEFMEHYDEQTAAGVWDRLADRAKKGGKGKPAAKA